MFSFLYFPFFCFFLLILFYRRKFLKHAANSVPFSSQVWNESIYLNPDVFIYNENKVNSSIGPKDYSNTPIQFLDRKTKIPLFTLTHPESGGSNNVEYLFHPFSPFVICISGSNMNIHYHKSL